MLLENNDAQHKQETENESVIDRSHLFRCCTHFLFRSDVTQFIIFEILSSISIIFEVIVFHKSIILFYSYSYEKYELNSTYHILLKFKAFDLFLMRRVKEYT